MFKGTNKLLVKIVASLLGSWEDPKRIAGFLVQCERAGFIKRYTGKSPMRNSYESTVHAQKSREKKEPLLDAGALEDHRAAFEADQCPEELRNLFSDFCGGGGGGGGGDSVVEEEEEEELDGGASSAVEDEEEDEDGDEDVQAVPKSSPAAAAAVKQKGKGKKRGRNQAHQARQESPKAANKKNQKKKKKQQQFQVGVVYDAALNGSAVDYKDVIHPVIVLEWDAQKDLYLCQLLAFWEDSKDWYDPSQLHPMRAAEEGPWAVDDDVQIRIRGRKVRGVAVDGNLDEAGVWVKGHVVQRNQDLYKVQHVNWTDQKKPAFTTLRPADMRGEWDL